jgi:uncharacterized protein (DUF4415 family)
MANNTRKLTAEEKAELIALRGRPDSEIDLTDPECLPGGDWSNGIRGAFYRAIKKPVAMRLDADVLDWFKRQGPGYQTRINEILREHMERQGR